MALHDETGREAQRRRDAARPHLDRYLELRDQRDAAVKLLDTLEQGSPAWRVQHARSVRLAQQARVAHRNYDEALAFGRPMTRWERRKAMRMGG